MNILDYLDWRGDIPFAVSPFNPVDNLILSQFAYLSLDGLEPASMHDIALELIKLGRARNDDDRALCMRLAESLRFGSARVSHSMELLDPALEMQFAAVAIDTDSGETCVAFRGTDATLVGWKEDLNMSFVEEIPSQGAAVEFLNNGLCRSRGPIRVMGHSKGGNLAVYAGAMCRRDIQDRIAAIYNNDGPGLCGSIMESDEYAHIESRISTFLPQSSVVGMLFNHPESYRVVHADAKEGISQHDPYVWNVKRDSFVYESGLRQESLYADRAIKVWLSGMSCNERREFVDTIYNVLQATHAHTIGDIASSWARSSVAIIGALGRLEPDTRKHVYTVIGSLLSSCAKSMIYMPLGNALETTEADNK